LIRSSNWLGRRGDECAGSPRVKNARPDAHITIAAPEKIAPVWKIIPEVDAIIPLRNGSLLRVVVFA